MYLISFMAVIMIIILSIYGSWGQFSAFHYFMDFPTLMLLLIICIPFLLSTGLITDFNNAFGIALGKKKKAALTEIKRAAEAVTLVIKSLLCAAALIFMMSIFTTLHMLDTPESLGPKISVCILTMIYASVFILLLLPLRSILNLRIIEYMSESDIESDIGADTESDTETGQNTSL